MSFLLCYKGVQSIDTIAIISTGGDKQVEIKLEDLVPVYGEKLLRYATSILYNHQDAEDVVQDVFISVYQNQNKFDDKNLSAWLYKITYNKSINKLKKRKFLFLVDIPKNTTETFQQSDIYEETLYALNLLKPQDRALLYGRIIEGYTYEELAEQMGKSPSTLRKRYERAKKKLADHMDFNYEAKGARI